MISPPPKGERYPGRLPPLRVQWARTSLGLRIAVVAVPLAMIGVFFAFSVTLGVTVAVFVAGVGAASVTYVKNHSDRHNAAVDAGEISIPRDPHLYRASVEDLPEGIQRALSARPIGAVSRFDGGWVVHRPNPREIAIVAGDDGGWARFDPRKVPEVWAAVEYLAGRGREAGGLSG